MKKLLILIIPVVLVLVAYHVLMYYDNRFPHGRMRETPVVKPYENPILIMDSGLVPTGAGETYYRVTPGDELVASVKMDDPAVIGDGKKVYFTYCHQCHGVNYDGNGTVGQSFHPLPTDLKSEKVQNTSEGKLFKTISYGLPSGRQPPLATTITIDERWRSVAFVKSLGIRK